MLLREQNGCVWKGYYLGIILCLEDLYQDIILILIFLMDNKVAKNKVLHTGNQIPMIGYGTYQLSGKDCLKGVQWALECGYTHLDTASLYGNQTEIGKVLEEMKVDRSKIYITSKISTGEQGYQNAKQACNNMLTRLKTNYLDLLIIHWPGVKGIKVDDEQNKLIRRQTWRALIELQKQGKVKDIGVSNYLKWHLQDLLANSQIKPAVNQFQIHPLLWQGQTIDFCRKHNIAIEAYSPLARNSDLLFKNESLLALSKKYNKTIAQICLRWAYQLDFIILPKSKTQTRIQQNFNIFDFELTAEDMTDIQKLTSHKVRTCWNPNSIIQ